MQHSLSSSENLWSNLALPLLSHLSSVPFDNCAVCVDVHAFAFAWAPIGTPLEHTELVSLHRVRGIVRGPYPALTSHP